ncbi:MAG: dienelactone hydrolase family protein [Deltaproteobacteria bacterium]|nr:dienelactone hydrolase family protein [Deltaproteobacteria bacterium]
MLTLTTTKLGPLVARVVAADEVADDALTVWLCHGYGAPGSDLCGIAGEVVAQRPALASRARFVFPEAPLELELMPFAGRAWWHIDVGRFERALATGELERLFDETPEGMPAARKALRAALDAWCTATKTPYGRVLLGGFSQGAMISTDLALRLEEAPAALAIFSGTLLCRPEWTQLAPARRGLRVLQSHGSADPLLPYPAALELRRLLEGAGLDLRFVSFPGGHGIDAEVIDAFAALVAERAGVEGAP